MRVLNVLAALIFGCLATVQTAFAVTVNIDLSSQTMHVTSASGESFDWPISSGKSGFHTPRGYYRPTSLQVMHYSRKYDMTPMPHSIFFRGGYAIHATSAVGALGRPASHGCIRLSPGNAAKLFQMVRREGARIAINGAPPAGNQIARARRAANPLAYAPRTRAPTFFQWFQNPSRF